MGPGNRPEEGVVVVAMTQVFSLSSNRIASMLIISDPVADRFTPLFLGLVLFIGVAVGVAIGNALGNALGNAK